MLFAPPPPTEEKPLGRSNLLHFVQMVEGLGSDPVTPEGLSLWGQEAGQERRVLVRAPLSQLKPALPFLRLSHTPERVKQVVDSVLAHGLLQPLLAVPLPDGEYGVLDGRLRLEAAWELVRSRGYAPERFTLPVVLLGGTLPATKRMAVAAQGNTAHPLTTLEKSLAFVTACAYGGIAVEELADLLTAIARHQAKKTMDKLAGYVVIIKALAHYGLTPAKALYYVRAFGAQPALLELARTGKVSERLLRLLAKPKVWSHPLFPNLLEKLRAGVSEDEVRSFVKGLLRQEGEEGYRKLVQSLKRHLASLPEEERPEALRRALSELGLED